MNDELGTSPKHFERRRQQRYPVSAGFLEIGGEVLKVDNVSESGIGFYAPKSISLTVGETHDAFLVLQGGETQYEIPIVFEVRRRDGDYIGAQTTYRADYHRETVREFIREAEERARTDGSD